MSDNIKEAPQIVEQTNKTNDEIIVKKPKIS